jgi:hypothetical protein
MGIGNTDLARRAAGRKTGHQRERIEFWFQSQEAVIALGRAFGDVVSAYGGGAPLIQDRTVLGYAARILATEAEHPGILRLHAALYLAQTKAVDLADILPPADSSRKASTAILNCQVPPRQPSVRVLPI